MNIRKVLALILCALLLLCITGCGAANDYAPNAGAMPEEDYIAKDESSADAENSAALPENRKLIQTAYIDAETEDLDAVLQQLDSRIAEVGGYIETSNVQNGSAYGEHRYRSANLTLRIPAKELNSFIDKVSALSNIVSSRKTVEDVTLHYVATESRMKALQTEENRLLELLAKSETLEDLLTVESRLTEVRTELEKVTSSLKVLDNQVDYATLHLSVSEVTEYTDTTEPKTVWQRIGVGFTDSLDGVGTFLENLFVFLIVSLPYMALIAVIPVTVLLIIGCCKRKKRKQQKQEEKSS